MIDLICVSLIRTFIRGSLDGMSKIFHIPSFSELIGCLHDSLFEIALSLQGSSYIFEHLKDLDLFRGPKVEIISYQDKKLKTIRLDLEHARSERKADRKPLNTKKERKIEMQRYSQHDLTEGGETTDSRCKAEFPQEKFQKNHNKVGDH